jgi:ribonuclease HI
MWNMFFHGASSSEGVGVGVVFVSPCQETISLSYKLEFETTNNVVEYEALVLGLRVAKEMGIEEVVVFRDAKLIVQQIRNVYRVKHPQLKSYKNEMWDLIDNLFSSFNISFIAREENTLANSLYVSTSQFRIPLTPKFKYDVEIRYRPFVPDNIKHWKVFEDDLEIRKFLESFDEFSALHIDEDHDPEGDPHPEVFLNKIANHHIVQLPRNHIPRGIVPLERLFDGNELAIKGQISNNYVDVAV